MANMRDTLTTCAGRTPYPLFVTRN